MTPSRRDGRGPGGPKGNHEEGHPPGVPRDRGDLHLREHLQHAQHCVSQALVRQKRLHGELSAQALGERLQAGRAGVQRVVSIKTRRDQHARLALEQQPQARPCASRSGEDERVYAKKNSTTSAVEVVESWERGNVRPRAKRRATSQRLATSFTRSTMRSEKPHSLSYQENTFAKRSPIVLVSVASKMLEWLLPMKSLETSCRSQYWR